MEPDKNNILLIFQRYARIINLLRERSRSYEQINEALAQASSLSEDLTISKRTLQRYFLEIRSLFGIDIAYNRALKQYEIQESHAEINLRILEGFDLFQSVKAGANLGAYILMEQKQAVPPQRITTLLKAINQRKQVSFQYQKFSDLQPTLKTVAPLAIKEFKERWYLLAKDVEKQRLRIYGLDRMKELQLSPQAFLYPAALEQQPQALFQHCFGIYRPDDQEPQTVRLWFSPRQADYVRSFPWHASQQIEQEDEEGLVITLQLYLTYDLEQAILAQGGQCKVLAPLELQDKIRAHLHRASALYLE